MKYLLQQENYLRKEKLIALKSDNSCFTVSYDQLESNIKNLDGAEYVPIGTVEFVNKYCELQNIKIQYIATYPIELTNYLQRKIRQGSYSGARPNEFVKPIKTKAFTGAIKQELTEEVPDDLPVWISDPVKFSAEFRCYIVDRKLIGHSRYDDGDDEVAFNVNIVEEMIYNYTSQPAGYSIDIGACDGRTLLVEVNDGWSLGFYPWGTMSDQKYLDLITLRWKQILEANDANRL